ncbi:MAG: nuclear transport factor 2 family protein [Bacteroidetes bacterium]|nr:nuclear transport factor 2 family protein [Bacteroidota bacterium]
MTSLDIVHAYFIRHNAGVAGGDFSAMLELFDQGGELHFASIPFGPFIGRDEIARAFREHPPSDHLVLIDAAVDNGSVHATYGWQSAPETPAGTIEGTIVDGRIRFWRIIFAPR